MKIIIFSFILFCLKLSFENEIIEAPLIPISNYFNSDENLNWLKYSQLHNIKDPYFSLPVYKGTFLAGKEIRWSSPCFGTNVGTLVLDNEKFVVQVEASNKTGYFCTDLYLMADLENFYIKRFWFGGEYQLEYSWTSQGEYEDVSKNGFFIFLIHDGLLGELEDLYQLYQVLDSYDPDFVTKFLEENAGWTWENRTARNITLDESDVMSGDYIASFQLDGESLLITYGTGGHTDHAGIALRINGKLYVVESCDHGIRRTLWADWFNNVSQNKLLALLRLDPKYQARFNETAALEWFESIEGTPYGWKNFIFGWIDTPDKNYPPPLSPSLMGVGMSILDRLLPNLAQTFYGEALNKRLGTNNLTTEEIVEVLLKKNMTLEDLISVPEKDSWRYDDNKVALVCSSFAMGLYRAAGLFPNLDFEVTEFTPKDSYQVKIFDSNWKRPAPCLVDDLPYCQLNGIYKLELPNWNSIDLYDHMNEKCGALPPKYEREPPFC